MVSVGTIVWLSSELMFFAALFAMYFSIRAAAPELWHEHTEVLNVWYALTFTTILVLSSITCQIGVFRALPDGSGRIMPIDKRAQGRPRRGRVREQRRKGLAHVD